jgi:fused
MDQQGLSLVLHLIDPNQNVNKQDLRFLQGSNFGCPYSGFYDQPISLLNKCQQPFGSQTSQV